MLISAPRYLFSALYGAALLVLIDQAAELAATLYPFNFTNLQWRFGAFGLIVGRTTTGVIVDILVVIAALGLQHRGFLRGWGIAHLVVAPILLMGLAVFVLDSLELRNAVPSDQAAVMTTAAARAVLMVLLAVIYCVSVTIAAIRATRRPIGAKTGAGATSGPVVVAE
jgi:hypothetical protein